MPSLASLTLPLQNKEEEGRPTMDIRKLDSAVDESSVDKWICKSDTNVHIL